MDPFLAQVSPEMVIATTKTSCKQMVATMAATYRAYARDRAQLAQLCDEIPDALQDHYREQIAAVEQSLQAAIDHALTAGVEQLASWYRDLSPTYQDIFLRVLHDFQTSLQGREGQAWFDTIVARLHTRLEDACPLGTLSEPLNGSCEGEKQHDQHPESRLDLP